MLRLISCCFLFAGLSALALAQGAKPNADLIVTNARIYTSDDTRPVVEDVALAMGGLESGEGASWAPASDGQSAPRLRLEYKRTEQAHLCLALPGLSLTNPDRYPLDLLSVILGEGMSSRLFLELREKRGLCYDIQSYAANFLDTGSFTIYAGVEPRRAFIESNALGVRNLDV